MRNRLIWLFVFVCTLASVTRVWAGATPTAELQMPQGNTAGTANGDYVTAATGGLNTSYHYWVEVPPALGRLVVEVFDADVGRGGNADEAGVRDRARTTNYNTSVTYTLLRPDGSTAATLNCSATTCTDNAWNTVLDSTTAQNTAAGHWELRVAMGAGDDINAIGIRAHDGTSGSGGTELNVYADSIFSIGVHPPATGTNTHNYTVYPYLTSGCTANESDFDFDSDSGTVGSLAFTPRGGGTTQTIGSANLAANNVWARNTINSWTSDQLAGGYGIWTLAASINSYNNGGQNGNYADIYVGNSSLAAGAPTANPPANSFRVYEPNDAGGAPSKTYLSQQLTFGGCGAGNNGPNPPVSGQTSCFTVTVQVVNPEAKAVTFSAANLVTVNVPGTRVLYAGGAAITQGSITAQPAVGGSGNITWNPGTVGAGVTATMSYRLKVTPTAAGQRNPMTGTAAGANGTRAQFLDITGNSSQARATYLFGPLCELATTVGLITPAVVTDVRASAADGGVAVEWATSSEVGTVSFDVLRFDETSKRFVRVNENPLPVQFGAQQGGRYRFLDAGAPENGFARYAIVEHDNTGAAHRFGPFRVAIEQSRAAAFELGAQSGEPFVAAAKALRRVAPVEGKSLGRSQEKVRWVTPGSTQVLARVTEAGVYRLQAQDIADIIGLPLAKVRKEIASHTLRLANLGQEITWFSDPSFDSLLFYGQPSATPFAPENVYVLSRTNGTPPADVVDLSSPPVESSTVRTEVHAEEQRLGATVVATDPRSDFYYWDYVYAADPQAGTRFFTVNTPGSAVVGADALLTVKLRGATSTGVDGEHHAVVRLNGREVGQLHLTGLEAGTAVFNVPSSLLHSDTNTIAVEGVLDSGVAFSIFYVDSFDLSYDRVALAEAGSMRFGGVGPSTTIAGFPSPDITVWDVSDPQHPAPVRGAVDLRRVGSTLSLAAAPGARYLAFTPSAIRDPALGNLLESTLLSPTRAADEVIVAPAQWLSTVESLAAWRRAQGLQVEVVSIEEIWGAFNFGMPDPLAIRTFLDATRTAWSRAPRYVLLAGNGTFDYRDYAGLGGNFVPPMLVSTANGLFGSDSALADFDGNGSPEMEVGRLPVASEAELADAIDKIVAYESSPSGAWVGKALLLADADADTDFSRDGNVIAGVLTGSYAVDPYELRTEPIQSAHGRLLGALNAGAGLLNFVGHGGLDRFSSLGLLTSDDVTTLNNGIGAPIVTAFTCMVNRFEIPGVRSLGAALADRRRGGAVAVLAPTGLSRSEFGRNYGQAFYNAFTAGGERLGDVIGTARAAIAGADDAALFLPLYNLLGDPALVLRRPVATPHGGGPPPPTRE